MADFFQNGVITTLQDITHRPVDELEADLKRFCEPQPLVLLLPALYSEFEGPAMPRIVAELKKTDYLNRIVLSGGCFANRLLVEQLTDRLIAAGREVFRDMNGCGRCCWGR